MGTNARNGAGRRPHFNNHMGGGVSMTRQAGPASGAPAAGGGGAGCGATAHRVAALFAVALALAAAIHAAPGGQADAPVPASAPLPAAHAAGHETRVASVSAPDGLYGVGRAVNISVSFDGEVSYSGAAPRLALNVSGFERVAPYASGSGTGTLVFSYTVLAGDIEDDLDYAGQNALTGDILDAHGNAASLILPDPGSPGSLSRTSDAVLDHAAPRLIPAGALPVFARDIDAIAVGDKTYAVAPSLRDAVYVIRVHENGSLSEASTVRRSDSLELERPYGVDAFHMNGAPHAIVASSGTFGSGGNPPAAHLFRLHENGSLSPVHSLPVSGPTALGGSERVTAFEMNGNAHALISIFYDGAVQLVNASGAGMVAAGRLETGGGLELGGPLGSDVFDLDGGKHAMVVSYGDNPDDDVNLLRIHGNGSLSPVHSLADNETLALRNARNVAALDLDGEKHALVTSYEGVQLVRVRGGGALEAGPSVRDPAGLGYARGASAVGAVASGGAYAVTAWSDNPGGVQLFHVRADSALLPAESAVDGEGGFGSLRGASDIATFDLGGRRHAIVTLNQHPYAVQLIRLSAASVANVSVPATANGTYGEGAEIDIHVRFDAPVLVAGTLELLLNSGGAARYRDGSGTDTLVFHYEVRPGEHTAALGYAGEHALRAAGPDGSITEAAAAPPGGGPGARRHHANALLPPPGSPDSLAGQSRIAIETATGVVTVSSPNRTGTYLQGETIFVNVTFSEPVSVSGSPTLELETGATDRNATYARGNGTASLLFEYTVGRGDFATRLDYASRSALALNGGSISALSDRAAAYLRLPDPGADGLPGVGAGALAVDGGRPSVVSVSSPNRTGTYLRGETILVNVTFSEPVSVSGSPTLELATGATDRNATYARGSGTASLLFEYTVGRGDFATLLVYASLSALALNGGSISASSDGLAASLSLPYPGAHGLPGVGAGALAVDGRPPEVVSVSSPNRTGTYLQGETILVNVTFSEPVSVSGSPTLELETGATDRNATYARGNGTASLLFEYTVGRGDFATRLDYASRSALALNGGSISASSDGLAASLSLPYRGAHGLPGVAAGALAVDGRPPEVVSVSSPNRTGTYLQGDTILVNVTFSEPVSVSGSPTLELETGATDRSATYARGNGTASLLFEYTVGRGDFATRLRHASLSTLLNGGSISALSDGAAAGLYRPYGGDIPGVDGALAVNGRPPWVESVSSPNQTGTYLRGETILVNVKFSEPVSVSGSPVLVLNATGGPRAAYVSVSGTASLLFAYTVGPGDFATNLAASYLAGGSIVAMSDRVTAGRLISDIEMAADGRRRPAVIAVASLSPPDPGADGLPGVGASALAVDGRIPRVESVSSPNRTGTYLRGDTILVNVTFSEPVSVSGSPTLELATRPTNWNATYARGSGTASLLFEYTVGRGDFATLLVYASRSALALNGGSITALWDRVAADLRLPDPGAHGLPGVGAGALAVDGGRPVVVTSVSSPNRTGTYLRGETILVNVTFSEPVSVSGSPTLELATWPTNRNATYARGSGTASLLFEYTVGRGDFATDLEYTSRSALALNGGSISALSDGAAADLSLPSPDSRGGRHIHIPAGALAVDGGHPVVTSVSSPNRTGTYLRGETIHISVTFSEPVSVSGSPTLELETGATDRNATYVRRVGFTSLWFEYTVGPGDFTTVLDYTSRSALALNGGSISALSDRAAAYLRLPDPGTDGLITPGGGVALAVAGGLRAESVSSPNRTGTYLRGETIHISVTFSEPVSVSGSPTLELETGATDRNATYARGSGAASLLFEYTVGPGDFTTVLDYTSPSALALNGGSISALSDGAAAHLRLPDPGTDGLLAPGAGALAVDGGLRVESVSSPTPAGTYLRGDTILVNVTFSERVSVSGSPMLELETGATDRNATYARGSGTASLLFEYTVGPGDFTTDLDYTSPSALALNGGSISALSDGAAAVLTLPDPGTDGLLAPGAGALAVNSRPPEVVSVSSPTPAGTYRRGETILVSVTFSEPVSVSGSPTLELETGATDRSATYVRGSGTASLLFEYTVGRGDFATRLDYTSPSALALNGGSITALWDRVAAYLRLPDPGADGLPGVAAGVLRVAGGPPWVVSVSSPTPAGTYQRGETILVSVTFSEPVSVSGSPTLKLETGATDRSATYVRGSGTASLLFEYTVGPGDYSPDLDYRSRHALQIWGADGGSIAAVQNGGTTDNTLPDPGADGLLGVGADALVVDDRTTQVRGISAQSGMYGMGSTVDIRVYFGENVSYSGVAPELALDVGGFKRIAPYSSGNGTDTLVFSYAVLAGDYEGDLDYAGRNALAGDIRDGDGNAVLLVLPSPTGSVRTLSASSNVVIHHGTPRLIPSGAAAVNGTDGFGALGEPGSIDAITVGNRTYAMAASSADDAVQVIRVHENGSLSAAAEARRGAGFGPLDNPLRVDAFHMAGIPHTIVTSHSGVHLFRLHENGSLLPVHSLPGSYDLLDVGVLRANAQAPPGTGNAHAVVSEMTSPPSIVRLNVSEGGLVEVGRVTTGSPSLPPSRGGGTGGTPLRLFEPVGLTLVNEHGTAAIADVAGSRVGGVVGDIHYVGGFETFRYLWSASDRYSTEPYASIEISRPKSVVATGFSRDPYHRPVLVTSAEGIQMIPPFSNAYLHQYLGPVALDTLTNTPDSQRRLFPHAGGVNTVSEHERLWSTPLRDSPGAAVPQGRYFVLPHGDDGDNNKPSLLHVRRDGTMSTVWPGAGKYGLWDLGSPLSYAMLDVVLDNTDYRHRVAPPSFGHTKGYVIAASTSGVQLFQLSTASVVNVTATVAGSDSTYEANPALWPTLHRTTGSTYGAGTEIDIHVQFDAPVVATGPLELLLSPSGVARYHNGSGTDTLVFRYEVQRGDRADALGYFQSSLRAAGLCGSISEAAATPLGSSGARRLPANTLLPGSFFGPSSIAIDGGGPEPTLVPYHSRPNLIFAESVSAPDGAYSVGRAVNISVRFGENVSYLGVAPELALDVGGFKRFAPYSSGNGTDTLVFSYTVLAGDIEDDLDYVGRYALAGDFTNASGGGLGMRLPPPGSPGSLSRTSDVVLDHAAPRLIPAGDLRGIAANGDIDALTVGNNTYAVLSLVGSEGRVIRVHENGSLSSTAVFNVPSFGGSGVDSFYLDGIPHVIVTSFGKEHPSIYAPPAVHLFRMHRNGSLSLVHSLVDGDGGLVLGRGSPVAAFEMAGAVHALVSAPADSTVQVINVSDSGLAAAGRLGFDGGTDLATPEGLDVFDLGGEKHALVAAWGHAVHLVKIRGDASLSYLGSQEMDAIGFAAAFDLDGVQHALVDTRLGVQLVRVHGEGGLELGGLCAGPRRSSLSYCGDGTLEAGSFAPLDYLGSGSSGVVDAAGGVYVAASHRYGGHGHGGGVHLLHVRGDGGALLPAGLADGGVAGFEDYSSPRAIATLDLGGRQHALVGYAGGTDGGGIKLIRLSAASVANVTAPAPANGTYGVGAEIDIHVRFDAPVLATGPLELLLNSGGVARYHNGSGTDTLVFRYEVQRGDRADSLGYAGAHALRAAGPGGSITEAGGAPPGGPGASLHANVALPPPGLPTSLGGQGRIAIDTAGQCPAAMFESRASDAPSLSDSAMSEGLGIVAAADAPLHTDAAYTVGSFSARASDAPSLSDSAASAGSGIVAASDAPSLSDSASAVGSFLTRAADSPSHSDAAALSSMSLMLLRDSPSLSDSASAVGSFSARASDAPSLSDSAASAGSGIVAASDAPIPADAAYTVGSFSALASDAPSLSDSAASAGSGIVAASDAPIPADAAYTVGSFSALASDSPTPADAAHTVGSFSALASDSPTPSDSASSAASFSALASDSPTPSDSASSAASFSALASDSPTPSDSASSAASFSALASDSPTPSDSASSAASFSALASDSPTPADAAHTVASFSALASDSPTPADAAHTVASFSALASDSPTPSDSASSAASFSALAGDSPTPSDSASSAASFSALAGDSPTPSDSASSAVSGAAAADSPAVADDASTLGSFLALASDSPAPADAAVSARPEPTPRDPPAPLYAAASDAPSPADSARSFQSALAASSMPQAADSARALAGQLPAAILARAGTAPIIADSASSGVSIAPGDSPSAADGMRLLLAPAPPPPAPEPPSPVPAPAPAPVAPQAPQLQRPAPAAGGAPAAEGGGTTGARAAAVHGASWDICGDGGGGGGGGGGPVLRIAAGPPGPSTQVVVLQGSSRIQASPAVGPAGPGGYAVWHAAVDASEPRAEVVVTARHGGSSSSEVRGILMDPCRGGAGFSAFGPPSVPAAGADGGEEGGPDGVLPPLEPLPGAAGPPAPAAPGGDATPGAAAGPEPGPAPTGPPSPPPAAAGPPGIAPGQEGDGRPADAPADAGAAGAGAPAGPASAPDTGAAGPAPRETTAGPPAAAPQGGQGGPPTPPEPPAPDADGGVVAAAAAATAAAAAAAALVLLVRSGGGSALLRAAGLRP